MKPPPTEGTRARSRLLWGLAILAVGAGGVGLGIAPTRSGGQQQGAPSERVSPGGAEEQDGRLGGDAETPVAEAVVPASPVPAAPAPVGPEVEELRRAIDGVLAGGRFWRRAEWSVLVVSLDRGDTLYARNPGLALAPASNMKLITTAAALYHLGPDFRYLTYVLADGPVEGGVLQGDLVLYGTGDPALSDRFFGSETEVFENLTDQLREAGIQAVAGDLVGDGSYFHGPAVEASWDPRDINEWFAAPVSALSYNENMVALRVEPAAWVGAPPRIQTVPRAAGVPIVNDARTVGAPPEAYRRLAVVRQTHEEPIRVVGEIAAGHAEVWREMSVSDPPHYAATLFHDVMVDRGIEVYGRVRSVHAAEESIVEGAALWAPGFGRMGAPAVVAAHQSPPLLDLLSVVNKESHNLFAESVLRSVGAVARGNPSFVGGVSAVRDFLTGRVGLPIDAVIQKDGSGLSSENRASAESFVTMLAYMAASDHWEAFWTTLPEAGRRGELPRMYRSAAAGNLRAKTGTIEGVSSLSGVVRSASGERLAFSIIVNGVPSTWRAKRLEDRIGISLAQFTRP